MSTRPIKIQFWSEFLKNFAVVCIYVGTPVPVDINDALNYFIFSYDSLLERLSATEMPTFYILQIVQPITKLFWIELVILWKLKYL